jgi:hypothetical protein
MLTETKASIRVKISINFFMSSPYCRLAQRSTE